MDKFSAIVLHGIAKEEENDEESIIVLIVDNDINKLKNFLVTLFVGGKVDSEQHLNLYYADLEFSLPPPFFGFVTFKITDFIRKHKGDVSFVVSGEGLMFKPKMIQL